MKKQNNLIAKLGWALVKPYAILHYTCPLKVNQFRDSWIQSKE